MPRGYDEYEEERDAGEADPYTGEMHTVYGDGQPNDGGGDEFDEAWSRVPFLGGGSQAALDREANERRQRDAEAAWQNLLRWDTPSTQELTPETFLESNEDEYGDLIGGPSELQGFGPSGDQQASLRALQSLYEQGGWTDRDASVARDLRRASAMERGQQLRGLNEGALQQMQARGMGGGGGELAARLSGSQALSQGQAIGDAQSNAALQQASMQRAMQALAGWQSGANTVQDQELARRNALDSFNQTNTDWRRSREGRNTAIANQGERDRVGAVQRQYENRERGVAGLTGQYQAGQGNRLDATRAKNEADAQQAGFWGGLLSSL